MQVPEAKYQSKNAEKEISRSDIPEREIQILGEVGVENQSKEHRKTRMLGTIAYLTEMTVADRESNAMNIENRVFLISWTSSPSPTTTRNKMCIKAE
jgi:hypothetical protein